MPLVKRKMLLCSVMSLYGLLAGYCSCIFLYISKFTSELCNEYAALFKCYESCTVLQTKRNNKHACRGEVRRCLGSCYLLNRFHQVPCSTPRSAGPAFRMCRSSSSLLEEPSLSFCSVALMKYCERASSAAAAALAGSCRCWAGLLAAGRPPVSRRQRR